MQSPNQVLNPMSYTSSTGLAGGSNNLTATAVLAQMEEIRQRLMGIPQPRLDDPFSYQWQAERFVPYPDDDRLDAFRYSMFVPPQTKPKRTQTMSFREIGDYMGEEVNRAIDQKMADFRRTIHAERALQQEITTESIKQAFKNNPTMLLDLVKEACSDPEWVSGLLDFYFSQDPTPIFKEALKEALA
jgi:hypothetical protein